MISNFKMQIVHSDGGKVVEWVPGSKVEVDLIQALCYKLSSRGLGIFTSQEKVLKAVEEEFAALLWNLKSKV